MGGFFSRRPQQQAQVQEQALAQLHIAHIMDTDKMLLNKMEDYLTALENKDIEKAKMALSEFIVISNCMILHLNDNTYREARSNIVKKLQGTCDVLKTKIPLTANAPFVQDNGLTPFEDLFEHYDDVLHERQTEQRLVQLNKTEDITLDENVMPAFDSLNKMLFVESDKIEKVNKGELTSAEELCEVEEADEKRPFDRSVPWPRYQFKKLAEYQKHFNK